MSMTKQKSMTVIIYDEPSGNNTEKKLGLHNAENVKNLSGKK